MTSLPAPSGRAMSAPPAPSPIDPVRPRLALRLGVTGHRVERIEALAAEAGRDAAAHEAQIADSLASVFAAIAAACERITAEPAAPFAAQEPLVRVILGAAFGVDRVAAAVVDERFRGRGASHAEDAGTAARPRSLPGPTAWRIETVVPAPLTLAAEAAWSDLPSSREGTPPGGDDRAACADDWRKVLARSDSVTILPASWRRNGDGPVAATVAGLEHFPPFAPADRLGPDYRLSYIEAANFQLQQIDLLVAIWDGEPARGPGGVAEVAAHAHEAGMPVVFIDAAVPERPPAMLRSIEFGPERRNIVGWSPQALKAVLEPADCRDAALADAVRSIVQLPAHDAAPAEDADHATPELTVADFYEEGRSAPSPARSYRGSCACWAARRAGIRARRSPTSGDRRAGGAAGPMRSTMTARSMKSC